MKPTKILKELKSLGRIQTYDFVGISYWIHRGRGAGLQCPFRTSFTPVSFQGSAWIGSVVLERWKCAYFPSSSSWLSVKTLAVIDFRMRKDFCKGLGHRNGRTQKFRCY